MDPYIFKVLFIPEIGAGAKQKGVTLQACISPAPRNWRRRPGRPRHTWLRTVEEDMRQFNLGLASGLRRAQNRTAWRTLTGTATSPTSSDWWWHALPCPCSLGRSNLSFVGCHLLRSPPYQTENVYLHAWVLNFKKIWVTWSCSLGKVRRQFTIRWLILATVQKQK